MKINSFWLGVIRGIGYPVITLVLAYFSDVNHIAGAGVSLGTAAVIAGIIGGLEHAFEATSGSALFGAVKVL